MPHTITSSVLRLVLDDQQSKLMLSDEIEVLKVIEDYHIPLHVLCHTKLKLYPLIGQIYYLQRKCLQCRLILLFVSCLIRFLNFASSLMLNLTKKQV